MYPINIPWFSPKSLVCNVIRQNALINCCLAEMTGDDQSWETWFLSHLSTLFLLVFFFLFPSLFRMNLWASWENVLPPLVSYSIFFKVSILAHFIMHQISNRQMTSKGKIIINTLSTMKIMVLFRARELLLCCFWVFISGPSIFCMLCCQMSYFEICKFLMKLSCYS